MSDIYDKFLAKIAQRPSVESLRAQALEQLGFDICGVYCLHTGRQVGSFDDFVIQFAIEEEQSEDSEDLINAMIARVVASMRPSPMLNMPDRVTLSNLAEKHPVDIFAYLANRLQSNRYLAVNRSNELLAPYIARISLHRQWTELAAKGVDLRPWIHWLLELDSKRNLHDLNPPCVELDKSNNWLMSASGEFLFNFVTAENAAQLLAVFEKWAHARIAEYDRRDREAEAEARWMRGNRFTQQAYARSWMENPEIAIRKKPKTSKPKSKKTPKAKKQDVQVAKFLDLMDQVFSGAAEVPQAKARPTIRTAGMLFKKKES